jgi:lipid-A-disaccharide synthase
MSIPDSSTRPRRRLTLLMVAGDVSGDMQAAHLARALRARRPDVALCGAGGERMRAAGVNIRLPMTHLSSVGLQESLRFVQPLRRAMLQLLRLVRAERPALAILVDNEGFNSTLASALAREGVPVVFYFPPQVWFWGAWRAPAVARVARRIITEFAGEAELYRRHGGRAVWFGHPLVDFVQPGSDSRPTCCSCGLDASRPAMALLPGSRTQELERLCAPLLGAARLVQHRHANMQFLLPLAAPHLRPLLHRELARAGMARGVTVVTGPAYACLSRCAVALMASGTATLEAALLGVPMVVAYRVSPLTYWLGRCLVKARFIARPNLLLHERVVPEFLQADVTAERLTAEALALIENHALADSMRARLLTIRPLLGGGGATNRAAAAILREAGVADSTTREAALCKPSVA